MNYQNDVLREFRTAVLGIPIKDMERRLQGYGSNRTSNLKHYKIPGGLELEVFVEENPENTIYALRRVVVRGPETELAEFSESSVDIKVHNDLTAQEVAELKKYTDGLLPKKDSEKAEGVPA